MGSLEEVGRVWESFDRVWESFRRVWKSLGEVRVLGEFGRVLEEF